MATDSPISGLPGPIATVTAADLLALVQGGVTSRVTAGVLFDSGLPIGSTTQGTGKFTVVEVLTSLELAAGATISEFSTDGTLGGNSDAAVPTEKAVKTYVDTEIASVSSLVVNPVLVSSDSTADIGDVMLVDTAGGDTDIELVATQSGRIEIKKTTADGNDVIITPSVGTIDGAATISLTSLNESISLIFDGSNYYIV